MNIGQASKASGVSAKMIRHYETIGLIPKAGRGESGYRRYEAVDIHRLSFVRRARTVGFATSEIKQLLALWQDRRRPSREIRRLAQNHLADVEARIGELKLIADTLSHLVAHCHGDDRPACPILEALEADGPEAAGRSTSARTAARRPPPARRSR